MKPRLRRSRIARSWFALAAALAMWCGSSALSATHATEKPAVGERKDKQVQSFPPAPAAAQGALSPELDFALRS